ncbi:MAG: DUF4105 domain-containing protein [Catalinimonas sp.]
MSIRHSIYLMAALWFGVPAPGVRAQSPAADTLSYAAEVSLITCGPGEALFEAFGHTALRVRDPQRGLDEVYNYGLFDFDQPNFYLNFAKGYLLYRLGSADFSRFLYQYEYYNRSVYEQVLNLQPAQQQALYDALRVNNLPENQQYYYDYFFDNCATRPRDVVEDVLGDRLLYDFTYTDTLRYSIRDLIDHYLEPDPRHAWGDLGIDLGLGATIDRAATPREYTYQPEFLAAAFAGATVRRNDGSRVPLVVQERTLFEARPQLPPAPPFPSPGLLLWGVFGATALVTLLEWRGRGRWGRPLDLILFGLVGAVGVLLTFLWFFTNHTAAAHNWNLLWAWPTHLLMVWGALRRRPARPVGIYFLVAALANLLTLVLWATLPQNMHEALIPLVLSLTTRGAMLYVWSRPPGRMVTA